MKPEGSYYNTLQFWTSSKLFQIESYEYQGMNSFYHQNLVPVLFVEEKRTSARLGWTSRRLEKGTSYHPHPQYTLNNGKMKTDEVRMSPTNRYLNPMSHTSRTKNDNFGPELDSLCLP